MKPLATGDLHMHATGAAGETGKVLYERRPKESHLDTVTYEIGMLSFCFNKLPLGRSCETNDEYLYLEGFLLHYRNLLEFFSGKRKKRGNMNIANSRSWAPRELRPTEIAAIVPAAMELDNKHYKNVSRYLQHCTLYRHRQRMSWDVAEMKDGIDPIIDAFLQAIQQ